jgi:Ca2+-binding EF-hand superfamily protein
MFPALGAASAAIDALKSLTSSKSSSATKTGFTRAASNPFEPDGTTQTSAASSAGTVTGGSGFAQISPQTMSALLDAQSQSATGSTTSATTSRSSALKDLFSQIDGDGDGMISKAEFKNALGAGGTNLKAADSVFAKLDKNGDGSVSLDEMSSALKGGGKGHHHHPNAGGSGNADGSNTDPLLAALQGASSTSTTNSDGTTTTSLTYADGSKVTMTSAASGSSSRAATSSYNFLEQMIQRDAKALAASATSSLSVSV